MLELTFRSLQSELRHFKLTDAKFQENVEEMIYYSIRTKVLLPVYLRIAVIQCCVTVSTQSVTMSIALLLNNAILCTLVESFLSSFFRGPPHSQVNDDKIW